MSVTREERTVAAAFEQELVTLPFEEIAPLYVVTPQKKASIKFKQIAASVLEIGLVEPIVVSRLCCTNRVKGVLPLSPDGLILRAL